MRVMNNLKPLLSYYGGKQRIASRIVEIINTIPHTVYVEPFCGGASVLFAKPIPQVSNTGNYCEVLNDKNDLITTFYKVAREQPEELKRWIQLTLYSQSEHRKAMKICKNPSEFKQIEVAWAVFVNLNQSFAKKMNAGWGTSVVGENHAATWSNKQDSLHDGLLRLRSVYISSEDAIACIKRWDSPQTLIYADPPYPETNQGHYSGYSIENFQSLCDALDSCQSSYILSNYQQPIAPKTAQECIEIETVMSAAKPKGDRTSKQDRGDIQRTEQLWVCDRSSDASSDLQKLMHMRRYEQMNLFA